MQIVDTIEIVNIDNTPCNRCSDFDDDCLDVVTPSKCWLGNDKLPPADGYCPMMYNSTER